MKIKLTNYDSSEYQQFEQLLNDLSSKGYNCNTADMFTFFKKDNQRCYYKTDIFVPQKKQHQNNREQRDQWLLNYVNHGYEFIGKSRKIYVFKASKNIKIKGTDKSALLTYFKRNKTISNVIFIFIALMLSFILIPSVFTNKDPLEFITNGTIILHYLPLLFCPALLFRFFYHYLTTEKIKALLTNGKSDIKTSKYLFNISNGLLIISLILIIAGISLDFMARKTVSVDNKIITLATLNCPNDATNNTYIKSSSIFVQEAISYQEEYEDNALIVNYYRYNSSTKAFDSLNDYLKTINFKNKKQISNGYLLSNDSVFNCIAFVKDKQLIVVQTTLDLLANDTYQIITSYNY